MFQLFARVADKQVFYYNRDKSMWRKLKEYTPQSVSESIIVDSIDTQTALKIIQNVFNQPNRVNYLNICLN